MHHSLKQIVLLLAVSAPVLQAAPLARRLKSRIDDSLDDTDENSIFNLNRDLAHTTPVIQQSFAENTQDGGVGTGNGDSFVIGLRLQSAEMALQIGCLNDATLCLQQGNSTSKCNDKQQFCEASHDSQRLGKLNLDGPEPKDDPCAAFNGTDLTFGVDAPFSCKPPDLFDRLAIADGGVVTFNPPPTPSTFQVDNDRGQLLQSGTPGPIGKGFKTLVVDNGNNTFTAGNLTSYNKHVALQIGCLFDEAACLRENQAGTNCTQGRLTCQTDNGLNHLTVQLAQDRGFPAVPPDGAFDNEVFSDPN